MVHFVPQNRAKSDRFPREARCIANGDSPRNMTYALPSLQAGSNESLTFTCDIDVS